MTDSKAGAGCGGVADEGAAQAPEGLERVTTRYSASQDRMCVAGELSQSRGQVQMWLTHRLLGRLVPVMCSWLETLGAVGRSAQGGEVGGPSGVADALYGEARQEFAQQAARAHLQPQAPVQLVQGSPEYLVESVEMVRSPEFLRLTFGAMTGTVAVMVLHPDALRQWLNIVFDAWWEAQWDMGAWPTWMREGGALGGEPALAVHLH